MHGVSALDCPGDNLQCLLDDFCYFPGPAICHRDRKEIICEIWVYLRIHQLEETSKDFSDAWDIIVHKTPHTRAIAEGRTKRGSLKRLPIKSDSTAHLQTEN